MGRLTRSGDTLSDDGNGLDLGVVHRAPWWSWYTLREEAKLTTTSTSGCLAMALETSLVDGQQGLAAVPQYILLTNWPPKGVDDAGHGGGFSLADEVKIEHALDSSGLETVDEASGLLVEESVSRERAQRPAGSCEAADVVVGRREAGGRCH